MYSTPHCIKACFSTAPRRRPFRSHPFPPKAPFRKAQNRRTITCRKNFLSSNPFRTTHLTLSTPPPHNNQLSRTLHVATRPPPSRPPHPSLRTLAPSAAFSPRCSRAVRGTPAMRARRFAQSRGRVGHRTPWGCSGGLRSPVWKLPGSCG